LTIIDSPASQSPQKTESDQSFADIRDGDCKVVDNERPVLLQNLQKVHEGDSDSDWQSLTSEDEL